MGTNDCVTDAVVAWFDAISDSEHRDDDHYDYIQSGGQRGASGPGSKHATKKKKKKREKRAYLRAHTQNYLQSSTSDGKVRCVRPDKNAKEALIISMEGKHFAIKSCRNGKYLRCRSDAEGTVMFEGTEIGDPEKWSVESKGEKIFIVSKTTGNALRVHPNTRVVSCPTPERGKWQVWSVKSAKAGRVEAKLVRQIH